MWMFIGGMAAGALLLRFFLRKRMFFLRDGLDGLRAYSGRMRGFQEFWYEGTGDPFLLVDGEGKLKAMNPAARRLLGVPAGEPVAGRPLAAFLKEECGAREAVGEGLAKGNVAVRRAVTVRPIRAPEAVREIALRIAGAGGNREAWMLFRGS